MMKDSLCSRGDKRTGRSEHIAAAGWPNAVCCFGSTLTNQPFLYLDLFTCLSRDSTSKNVSKHEMNMGERNGTILFPIKKIKIKNNNHFRNRPLTLSTIAYFDAE